MRSILFKSFVVLLLLQTMGVVSGLTSPDMSDDNFAGLSTQVHLPIAITQGLIYAFFATVVLMQARRTWRSLGQIKPLLFFVFFCILSTAWSQDPAVTFRRALVLLATTIVGVVVGSQCSVQRFGRLLSVASLIHIFLVGVFFVAARNYVYSASSVTSLRGLAGHKNIFGIEMGFAAIVFLFTPFRRLGAARWLLTLLALVLLLMSRSAGSLVATTCGFLCLPLWRVARFRGLQKIPILLVSGALVTAFVVFVSTSSTNVLSLLSRDSTLTGRTEVWHLMLLAIGHHPLLGYGFDAFWQGLKGASLEVVAGSGWLVPTAHNGYLDLLAGVGVMGAILFLPPFFQAVKRSLAYLTLERSSAKYLPVTFIVIWLTYNLEESSLITRDALPYLLFVVLTTSLAVHHRRSAPVRSPVTANTSLSPPPVFDGHAWAPLRSRRAPAPRILTPEDQSITS